MFPEAEKRIAPKTEENSPSIKELLPLDKEFLI